MERHPLDDFEDLAEDQAPGLPEDVAILYSWASLPGGKYRDFSANRREHRAQMRQRAADQLKLAELRAQSDAEAAAKQADAAAATAHAAADAAAAKLGQGSMTKSKETGVNAWSESSKPKFPLQQPTSDSREKNELTRQASLRAAAQLARRAAAEREEAARRSMAAALAESIAQREHEEIMEAQASALRQAARYEESGIRHRTGNMENPDALIPGKLGDPYLPRWYEEEGRRSAEGTPSTHVGRQASEDLEVEISLEQKHAPDDLVATSAHASDVSGDRQDVVVDLRSRATKSSSEDVRAQGDSRAEVVRSIPETKSAAVEAPKEPLKTRLAVEPVSLFEVTTHAMSELFEAEPVTAIENPWGSSGANAGGVLTQATAMSETNNALSDSKAKRAAASAVRNGDVAGPAWLYPRPQESTMNRSATVASSPSHVGESLDLSKERIAARWFALRGVFARQDADRTTAPLVRTETKQPPFVAVFSVAGGTGKTSLVATLGRALSFLGERVLLGDTTSHGLLPFYFGASQLVSGVVRTFSPPAGSTDAPIHLVSYDAGSEGDEAEEGQAGIVDDLLENSQRANRVLLDLSVSCSSMVGRLGQLKPTILVPLMPDMNSVISIHKVEKLFSTMLDAEGRPLQPVYLLNQFDASLPLHLDIREVLKQQFGSQLLPFVIRRSPAIGEALAEGMTVVDYDPGSAVAEDYLRLANWLRSISAPVAVGFRNQRWSEQ